MAAIPNWQDAAAHAGPHKCAPVQSIALALGKGARAKSALAVARGLGALYEATLHILCLDAKPGAPREQLARYGIAQGDTESAVLEAVRGDADAIAEALDKLHSPLLVMGGLDGESEMGRLVESLLRRPVHRVVLVGPESDDSPWEARRVLLAHDGAPSTDVATAAAADIAHRAGAEVLAMHVAARNSERPEEPGSIIAPRYMDQPQHEWPSWANEFLDRMIALGSPPAKLRFKLMVAGGRPGSEIVDFSRENGADLVVAAWHGGWDDERGGILRVLVRRAPCPVLLVHAPEPPKKPPR